MLVQKARQLPLRRTNEASPIEVSIKAELGVEKLLRLRYRDFDGHGVFRWTGVNDIGSRVDVLAEPLVYLS